MRKLGSVCIGGCSILCRLDKEAPSSEESGDTTWDMRWKRLPGGWEHKCSAPGMAAYRAQSGNHREARLAGGSQGESGQGLWGRCQKTGW